jgi:hypothetical protein
VEAVHNLLVVEGVEDRRGITGVLETGNEHLVGKSPEEDASMEHLVVGEVTVEAGNEDQREEIEDLSVEIVEVAVAVVDSFFDACFAYWIRYR